MMNSLLEVKDRAQWRSWLKEHGTRSTEVWLVCYKKGSGKAGVAYEDAVEEALCFGWIDGKIKKLDHDRFARRFTPRNSNSRWSAINIGRAKKLIAGKKMTSAGVVVFHPERKIEAHPTRMPIALRREFEHHASAWKNFQDFPPSYQRMTIAWVASAKKKETQHKRLQQLVQFSSENKRIKFM
jgi:uncharacterized protein YdeI (YjbR/CyaY-like superfamily)